MPLILGGVLIIGFVFWEIYGAKFPMFPKRLNQAPRTLALTLVITFVSGTNFFAILMFWPTQAFNVYGHSPVGVGIRGLPIALAIMTGAIIVLCLLSYFRGRNKELLIVSSVLMTAGMILPPFPGPASFVDTDFNRRSWVSLNSKAGQSLSGLGPFGSRWPRYWRHCRSSFYHDNYYLP